MSTIGSHAAAVKGTVTNCGRIRKTPTLPVRGPMPLAGHLGMGIAVEILFNSLTARSRLKGKAQIQFNSMRCPCATYTLTWESSQMGVGECSTFASGSVKVTVTSCPTQQKWFGLFLRGAENRMGYISQRNQLLCEGVIQKLLEAMKVAIQEVDKEWLKREYIKFGAAASLAICGLLRGPEVFLLDLAGLWEYLELGRGGVLPEDPLKPGADFSNCPHIIVTLIGEFKRELGTKHHLIALASWTTLDIELRWWLEELLRVQEAEGCKRGPAFGHKDGSVALMSEYDNLLHFFLRKVQNENPELILHSDNIKANYSFLPTFRRTAEGKARGAQLDSSVQKAMNRWRKIEARQLMSVMWQYSFVQ
jgi:hypothetical protein